ncbi:UNVERIFIED_CONTAM: hypothetical protein RMT77_006873 [Armadillidium vulgare]
MMMRGMRALIGVCLFVILGLVTLSTLSSGPPTTTTLHSLVTQTHNKLNQLHKLKEELGGNQPLDSSLLTDLGFIDKPTLYPNHLWFNISVPVIVSAISSRQIELVPELIKVTQILSVNGTLILYSLDLSEEEFKEVGNECNESCILVQFDFSPYPYHVQDLRLGAYRSIIIQKMLQLSGIVFWIDPCMQLFQNASSETQHSEHSLMDQWVAYALKVGGVLAWPLRSPTSHLPTSALTHPDMFTAFRTVKHNYDFQQMSDPKAVLIVNTPIVHQHLMRPWVTCALIASCLSPIGAQDTGCKYNKKPLFRYSGCHLYDTSAFNVALGLTFGMDNDSYLDTSVKFSCLTKTNIDQKHPPPYSYGTGNSGSTSVLATSVGSLMSVPSSSQRLRRKVKFTNKQTGLNHSNPWLELSYNYLKNKGLHLNDSIYTKNSDSNLSFPTMKQSKFSHMDKNGVYSKNNSTKNIKSELLQLNRLR